MAQNEKTSQEVAALASKFLKMKNPRLMTDKMWAEIQSVMASALTQTADKPKSTLAEMYRRQRLIKGLGASPFPELGLKGFGLLPPKKK